MSFINAVLHVLVLAILAPLASVGHLYSAAILAIVIAAELFSLILRSNRFSYAIWWTAILSYVVGGLALLIHLALFVCVTDYHLALSATLHAFELSIFLLSNGIFQTFSLPGPFQLAFSAHSTGPQLIFDPVTLSLGLMIGTLGLITLARTSAHKHRYLLCVWGCTFTLLLSWFLTYPPGTLSVPTTQGILSSGLLFLAAITL
jgi:hypothetical protein